MNKISNASFSSQLPSIRASTFSALLYKFIPQSIERFKEVLDEIDAILNSNGRSQELIRNIKIQKQKDDALDTSIELDGVDVIKRVKSLLYKNNIEMSIFEERVLWSKTGKVSRLLNLPAKKKWKDLNEHQRRTIVKMKEWSADPVKIKELKLWSETYYQKYGQFAFKYSSYISESENSEESEELESELPEIKVKNETDNTIKIKFF